MSVLVGITTQVQSKVAGHLGQNNKISFRQSGGGRGGHLKGGGASHQGERKVRGDKGRRLVQVITEEEEPLRAGALGQW